MLGSFLLRFCTTPYEAPSAKNIDCAFMHLTNYAVNKKNTEFVQPSVQKMGSDGEENDDQDDDDGENEPEVESSRSSDASDDEEAADARGRYFRRVHAEIRLKVDLLGRVLCKIIYGKVEQTKIS